jgi:hypothetical protein
MAQVLGVGDHVDPNNLAVRDREPEDEGLLPTLDHGSHSSVHQRRLQPLDAPRDLPGHSACTADFAWCAHQHGGAVGPQDHIWVEHRQQRVEVPLARGC